MMYIGAFFSPLLRNMTSKQRLETVEKRLIDGPMPDWAQNAFDSAVKDGLIDTPEDGSYDFYRLLTVLHRKCIV
jgi:hypothetical protein